MGLYKKATIVKINKYVIGALMSSFKLENAVLVSGAGQRIGAYLVRQLLKNTDYPVVFTYRTKHAEVAELQRLGAIAIQADFTEIESLPGLVEKVSQQVCSLRAIIHNASLWLSDEQAPVGSEAYRNLFQVHVDAPHYLNGQLENLLREASSDLKDIISISDYSINRIRETHIGYLASKAALRTLSQGYAKKLAPEIKVNDIAPALIAFNEGDNENYKAMRLKQAAIPIEPGYEVVWQAVDYLMKSPYSTGSVLQLDGGRHLI